MKKKTAGLHQPFFASFLESQAQQAIQGGDDPSPTNALADQPQTMKYPSDQEDNPSPTSVIKDSVQTMKAPSDNDEWR
ncbi:microviridin/marinostatin family tricyclic proteinase inhibitor [Taibaiella koreensis]|uniref:microviridin/marinostatin family tricyclic proteinase inhibitor n=1 Tax=Taibaiella koreensis TaxID=1268548 RepID=UPI000E5A084D|nr:microviridin/marinostatin family tricyclic proteinase inhibitor [Taibaiella koreensis]